MGFTTIKALVNMTNQRAALVNRETNANPLVATGFSATSCPNWAVPWCSNAGEFAAHHLELEFLDYRNGSLLRYFIWQENFGGRDRIRFVGNDVHDYRAPNDPGGGSRLLAAGYNGGAYDVSHQSDAILVIDQHPNGPWVILYRIGV